MNTEIKFNFRKAAAVLICLIMSAGFLVPRSVSAEEDGEVIRVGWYDSTYNTVDEYGRRSGYAYDYQLKIASYTGWTYQYVTGSWSELLDMLKRGEIDLMTDVSYTEEREKYMYYSSLPMGTEEYYVFALPDNTSISNSDYTTLNGKKIGVNKSSIQADFYRDWAEQNGIVSEVIEVSCTEEESVRMLERHELDAYVTVDSFIDPNRVIPICKVGSSDFFFAVSKNRPDLLKELDLALSRIQDENRLYNQELFEKYIKRSGANTFLSPEEVDWLDRHGPIRVGYQDNYLAFCEKDEATGELSGALKDILDYSADAMANASPEFEAIAFPTVAAALEALKNGEVDCVFPVNLSGYDGETLGIIITPALIRSDVLAVVSVTDQKVFSQSEHVIVAVNEGNPNYEAFLLDHYPSWQKIYYPSTADCLKAVGDGVADSILISNYRYNNIFRLCEKYHLTTIATGENMDYCFAVAKGQTRLFSILAKIINHVPESAINAAMSYYVAEDSRLTVFDYISDNLVIVLTLVSLIVLVILGLMFKSMRSERIARRLISATEIDELTGLYNRGYFLQYANRMMHEHPDIPMDAMVLNIEQFHSLNALSGREFGDEVLRVLGAEIHAAAKENAGIAGRFEADRFDIFCRHIDDYRALFDRFQGKLDNLAPNTSIQLRMGVMPWQKGIVPIEQFDHARTACSMARNNYKEHLIIFDEKVRNREIYERRLLNDLRQSLDSFEFEVYYQPKFDIREDAPKLVSAEALVRWQHHELGMISPEDFIPLFEKNGKIGMIDKYVWSEAAHQHVRWKEEYGAVIPISVNLSRVDIFDPELEKTLDEILAYNGIDHNSFRLEVTETAYTENADHVIRVVESLRDKGYIVEMDDFGTGYSSLNMLSAMPVDVLKMDRAFIRDIDRNEKDVQLVALILGIAKNLKIPVIAEGVETAEQMNLLKKLGCSVVQGYYFSRPLQAADFESDFLVKKKFAL